ncbi:hypothetical protein HJG60_009998 [Phyllostomus discolor]|uniref:Uncharacterized protein n=1 Tax=Phyllostomus discolor TaxID=89673 RepID=A0A834DBK0_9CHIR|nr:hypothetical protein HJG60_009998 [Phyllostomus discolor]
MCPECQGRLGSQSCSSTPLCPACFLSPLLSPPLLSSPHLVLNAPHTLTSIPAQPSLQRMEAVLTMCLRHQPFRCPGLCRWSPQNLNQDSPDACVLFSSCRNPTHGLLLPVGWRGRCRIAAALHPRALETRGLKGRKPGRERSWLWVCCHQRPFPPQGASRVWAESEPELVGDAGAWPGEDQPLCGL